MRLPLLTAGPQPARPYAAGLAARLATVAAVTAIVGTLPAPAPSAPAALPAQPARLAPAVTAAHVAAPAPGVAEVDEENVVAGAAAEDVPVGGVAAEARDEAPAGAQGDEVAVLTTPEEAEIRFQGLGVTWDAATREEVLSVKVRLREDGVWTAWTDLEQIGDRVESGGPRTGTDPILTDGADGYQVELLTASGRAPEGVQVNLIDPGVGSLDEQIVEMAQEAEQTPVATLSAARVDAQTGEALPTAVRASAASDRLRPAVVRRSAWGADESSAHRAPQNARLSAMYIHHTASSNTYSRATAAAQLRAIHHYHAEVLGWGDIGYHILVDRFGTVYEGARGSLDSLPRGGHALGFNRDTFAVSALGDYSEAAPSAAMVEAITRVVAWKAAAHGLDPQGTTTLTSAGNSRHAAGARVSGPAVRGHQSTNATACPGAFMVDRLPAIRRGASALIAQAQAGRRPSPTPDRLSVVGPRPTPAAPSRPAPSTSPAAGAPYTVRAGEGWWSVARRTGVSAGRLQRLNGMGPSTVLHPGMVLKTAPRARAARTAVVDHAPLVNLRAGAGTSTARLARVKRGTRVTVTRTAKDGAWAYVVHPTFKGWMSTAYLR